MYYFLLLLVVIGLFIFFTRYIIEKAFRNPYVPHQKSPAEYGIDFEEVRFPTKNGKNLYGWWIPGKAEKSEKLPVFIMIHGWGRNVQRMLSFIKHLHGFRCHLLAIDARSHGSSDYDDYVSMIKFAEDIISAVDYALTRENIDKNRVGVIGHSIGGGSSVYAAALDQRIKKVVSLGGFANPRDVMIYSFKEYHIPYFLIWLILHYVQLKIKADFKDIAPENNIAKTKAQILIVHGKIDPIVPFEHAERLYAGSDKQKTELLALDGVNHSNYEDNPEFWPAMEKFLCSPFPD